MYLFIVNPAAGNGKALALWTEIKKKLQQHKSVYTVYISHSKTETEQFLSTRIHSKEIKVVAVIGGDGTTSSVVQFIAGTEIALAILPAGSGNDTARMFRLTNEPYAFFKGLLNARTTTIDLLKVNDRFGVTVAGVGIDAAIGQRVDHAFYKPLLNKLGIGSFAYTIAPILAVLSYQPFKANVTIDGHNYKMSKAWLIACGNTTSYGGGLTVCPQALPTDGFVNATLLHSVNRMTLLFKLFPALLQGGPIYKEGVVYKTGKEINIETTPPVQVVMDGEMIASTPIHITIHEKSLQLLLTS